MNRNGFVKQTLINHIRDDSFSLEGGLPGEKYVLEIVSGGWQVYYSERGLRVGVTRFESEDEACSYLLECLLKDPTTRIDHLRAPNSSSPESETRGK